MSRVPARLAFFDTARASLVLLVVGLHAAAAYAAVIPWWHVRDAATAPFFDLVMSVLDGFLMPTLFFIAGAFAPGSLGRRGPAGFFRAKVRRFMPTLLIYLVTLLPLMTYVGYVSRTADPMGFPAYFAAWLASGADLSAHLYTTVEDGLATRDSISPHHLWFLVVLVGLFGGYALWRAIFPKPRGPVPEAAPGRGAVGLLQLGAAGCAMALACALTARFMPDGAWFKATALVVAQPTRLPLYVGCFALGAHAAARGGLSAPWPGRWWGWLATAVVSLGVMFAAYPAVIGPARGPFPVVLAHYLGRTFLCLGVVGMLATRGCRRPSEHAPPGRLARVLAASSYHVYLLHMPLVVILQYALLDMALSLYVKFGAAWLGAVAVSALLSVLWRGAVARLGARRSDTAPAGA